MPADDPNTDRIEEIRARAEKATPPPWTTEDRCDGCCGSPCTPDGCHESHPTGERLLYGPNNEPPIHSENSIEFYRVEDAAFVAHAREDIPYLLDRLAEVERERDANMRAYIEYQPPHEIGGISFGGAWKTLLPVVSVRDRVGAKWIYAKSEEEAFALIREAAASGGGQ